MDFCVNLRRTVYFCCAIILRSTTTITEWHYLSVHVAHSNLYSRNLICNANSLRLSCRCPSTRKVIVWPYSHGFGVEAVQLKCHKETWTANEVLIQCITWVLGIVKEVKFWRKVNLPKWPQPNRMLAHQSDKTFIFISSAFRGTTTRPNIAQTWGHFNKLPSVRK